MVLMVGLKDMERARSTIEDFCRSYFMFHNMNVLDPGDVFSHLPILMCVEAFIYELDERNEDELQPPLLTYQTEAALLRSHKSATSVNLASSSLSTGCMTPEVSGRVIWDASLPARDGGVGEEKGPKGLGSDPFKILQAALADRNLLTERIKDELRDGLQYWELEQSLCNSVSVGSQQIRVEDVVRAIQLKSFDYRILNLLLYLLRKQPVDEAHFEFLSVSELLVEISDDLFDYEEDVLNNSFNVLRMFLYIYGPCEAPTMLAKFIGEAEERYQNLLHRIEPTLAAKYQRRCEEALREGGSKSKHVLGSWTIPPLITNEKAYRDQVYREIQP